MAEFHEGITKKDLYSISCNKITEKINVEKKQYKSQEDLEKAQDNALQQNYRNWFCEKTTNYKGFLVNE